MKIGAVPYYRSDTTSILYNILLYYYCTTSTNNNIILHATTISNILHLLIYQYKHIQHKDKLNHYSSFTRGINAEPYFRIYHQENDYLQQALYRLGRYYNTSIDTWQKDYTHHNLIAQQRHYRFLYSVNFLVIYRSNYASINIQYQLMESNLVDSSRKLPT